ncbi:dihydrofolate synthase/folylpolyglutamate synthase [Weissella uvarum]|uniref:bifunctional folylpolyglutamate synthase/dihydrofolate synthase n=1 Tax=Weissella uvarum TaxID=1479233 RepID=UPI001960DAC5|nr:tetrahydrofolate synthase [Weissella uvarum]MBM7617146.1 dihydrofolate synthase/folylpolyglutamate synthase [Weissella uvarum]MCM0595442.1 tetrahydrofolate synthase [Weissella uvarum]
MPISDIYRQINKRISAHRGISDDDRTRTNVVHEVLNWIGQPDKKVNIIHLVGTNGKGSMGAMLAAILKKTQYKVGHFTSPVIHDDLDMIRLDGHSIKETDFIASYQRILKQLERHGGSVASLTKFEWWVLIALDYFGRNHVDYVVLEAGEHGLSDPTNAIDNPLVVAFTRIAPDLIEQDREDLVEITQKKSGAIKPGATVVSYPGQDHRVNVYLKEKTAENGAVWYENKPKITLLKSSPEGLYLNVDDLKNFKLSLTGSYQMQNLSTVLQIVEVLRKKGASIRDVDMVEALSRVKIEGRMDYDPKLNILFDGAHNQNGISNLIASMIGWHLKAKPIMVLGFLRSTNWYEMLDTLLPYTSSVITVTPDSPDAMNADELAAKIVMMSNVNVEVADDPTAAISLARQAREDTQAMIVVTGSFYTLKAIEEGNMYE